MLTEYTDFNNASQVIQASFAGRWSELAAVLGAMPLHLKASDQAGVQGNPIFNPVGTNAYIKAALSRHNWQTNIRIPPAYAVLGKEVDYGCGGLIAEAQFSNYPFLLNNVLRSELFYKSKTALAGEPVGAVIIITKGRILPSSNSTLHYEQAVSQVAALASNHVFDVPMRIVGLQIDPTGRIPIKWTTYHTPRYSRTVIREADAQCEVTPGRSARSRCRLRIVAS